MPETTENNEQILSVSEVNRTVKELLEQTLYPVWVRGEVSNLKMHRTGHVYLSLKDDNAELNAVFFRGVKTVKNMELSDGSEIDVFGRLTLYEVRGKYQIIINKIVPRGKGALRRRFEEQKQKLRSEGLFDEERKRQVPEFPQTIGVVTSSEGAALRDFLQVIGRRFAKRHIRIYPAAVQGDKAANEIAAGIQFFNRTNACDVIVTTRGGGSLEDLWPFNEEVVARAVASSEIPVISAVGHEVDYTIADYVADMRAPTPSAAAELIIGKETEYRRRISHAFQRLDSSMKLIVSERRRRLERASRSDVFREPSQVVRAYQQRLDELSMRITHVMDSRLADTKAKVQELNSRLSGVSPQNTLERGYSILLDREQDKVVKRADDTQTEQGLEALLAEGKLGVKVETKGGVHDER